MVDFVDKTSAAQGTPLNRANMMALQGFETKQTFFNADGSITETNMAGHTKTTTFGGNTITEVFIGDNNRTITKTTTFNSGGTISEVIS